LASTVCAGGRSWAADIKKPDAKTKAIAKNKDLTAPLLIATTLSAFEEVGACPILDVQDPRSWRATRPCGGPCKWRTREDSNL
jgi:hypothetical protein